MRIFSSLGIMTGDDGPRRERGAYSPRFGGYRQPRALTFLPKTIFQKNLFFLQTSPLCERRTRSPGACGQTVPRWELGGGRFFLGRFDRIARLQNMLVYMPGRGRHVRSFRPTGSWY
jgi:hypothetical protein